MLESVKLNYLFELLGFLFHFPERLLRLGAVAAILLFQESEANVKESRAEKQDLELIVL